MKIVLISILLAVLICSMPFVVKNKEGRPPVRLCSDKDNLNVIVDVRDSTGRLAYRDTAGKWHVKNCERALEMMYNSHMETIKHYKTPPTPPRTETFQSKKL